MSSKRFEEDGSPRKMQLSFIQHSINDPEKSTVIFEARIETRAKAFSSPGGTITFPDCDGPNGLEGVNRAAIRASCKPLEALPIVYPAECVFFVLNFSWPGSALPA